MKLLSELELESSCIVANNRMNRERVALGSNGYETDLQFNPIEFLLEKYADHGEVAWLDICCGRGKAMIETGQKFFELGLNANTAFIGVDLVGMFDPVPDSLDFVSLIEASFRGWETTQQFDLVTCVHGLHYVGDKLNLIKRAISMLAPNGHFAASLDPSNLRMLDTAQSNDRQEIEFDFVAEFQTRISDENASNAFRFDADTNLFGYTNDASHGASQEIEVLGKLLTDLEFVGADDEAGPNYTGQEAVNSFYRQL